VSVVFEYLISCLELSIGQIKIEAQNIRSDFCV